MELELQKWSKQQKGVFSIQDLRTLMGSASEAAVFRKIKKLTTSRALIKVKRGLYVTPEAELVDVSARICPKSYVSLGTVLAQHALLGSYPAKRIQAVKVGEPRSYKFETGAVEHLSISPQLYFGSYSVDGVLFADKEKAFLDTCYFYYKGKRFSFDPVSDVAMENLDMKKMFSYLKKFDQRFVTYFRSLWGSNE